MARRLDPSYPLVPEQAYQILIHDAKPTRAYLNQVRQQLTDWFLLGADTEILLNLHAQVIDNLLVNLWQQQNCADNIPIALLAVGGYGRGQLHLHSDIDIAFILADEIVGDDHYLQKIQNFITLLWDSHLIIGHSVRSLSETWQQARADQTILTNLLESRWLCGDKQLAESLQKQLHQVCSPDIFLQQKYNEYRFRHAKYAIPPYTLEPDIKCSPGGQRDMQLIEWLMLFTSRSREEAKSEWDNIKKYLNTLRFALHLQNTKANDQLVFDHQLQLAKLFSEEGANNNQAVSNFMRRYFKYTRRSAQLVNRALQQLGAFNFSPEKPLELRYPLSLEKIKTEPWLVFELFAAFSEQTASTVLDIDTQYLLDQAHEYLPQDCYKDKRYQSPFLRILNSAHVTTTLALMHDYHLLGKYIPLVDYITGMMQYDLFHAYPVDQHSLLLVEKLENIIKGTQTDTFILGTEIAKKISKPELLYIAGFFHDIGKGQKGRHEDIGAVAVKEFCQCHHYSADETELVRWLVQNHLLLSYFAQQKDIANPSVIKEFAEKVKDINTLNYLYLLTIADIYATNNKLWTGWRISLIDSIYQSTYHLLSEPLHQQYVDMVEENKQQAKSRIPDAIANEITDIWKNFNADYFLNYPPAQLAEQAKLMVNNKNTSIIHIHTHASKNATEIFIYTPHHSELFFAVTSVLAAMQLSIVAAQMHITQNNYNLSTYIVLPRGNKPLEDQQHIERVQMRLNKQLQSLDKITPPTLQPLSARLQTFNYPTTLEIEQDEPANCTLLRLFTVDRQGLLANIAQIFYQANIQVLRTKINTLAERAEDNFWLVNNQQFPLSPAQQTELLNNLQQMLKGSLNL